MASTKGNKKARKTGEITVIRPATFGHVAKRGIKTMNDVNRVMAALIVDLGDGTVNANTGHVVVKAASTMLVSTALQLRYGAKKSLPVA